MTKKIMSEPLNKKSSAVFCSEKADAFSSHLQLLHLAAPHRVMSHKEPLIFL